MKVSILYTNLRKRVFYLKKQLSFDTKNSQRKINQDKLRAFKLLAHAELESYIENAVLEVLNRCEAEWQTNQKMLPSLQFLIIYPTSRFEANESQLTKEDRVRQILDSFKKSVANNNGIKRKNVLLLVVPLGVDYNTIDETWLSTIDSYGADRGKVAHRSFSVQQQIDKMNELNNLDLVLKGFRKMDLQLQNVSISLKKPL